MASIHTLHTKKRLPSLKLPNHLWLGVLALASCTYRLTNSNISPPHGIRTIAVESVFDTGGEVIPHDQFWSQLQRAFAANGHLKVVSASEADALARMHIRQTTIVKSGERVTPDRDKEASGALKSKKDPELYAGQSDPPAPGLLRDLSRAGDVFRKDNTIVVIDVEVWDLSTRSLILQRQYATNAEVFGLRLNAPREVAFLRHDEALDAGLSKAAKQIAETVVTDLLVR